MIREAGVLQYAGREIKVLLKLDSLGQPTSQAQWSVRDVAACLFRAGDPEKKRKRVTDCANEIKAAHARIWPFFEVPKMSPEHETNTGQRIIASTMPTSMLFALLLHLFSSLKRGPQDRRRAAEMLRWLVSSRMPGRTVALLYFRPDGRYTYQPAAIDEADGTLSQAWSQDFSEFVARVWDKDLTSAAAPWVTTTRQKPALADYLLFSLSGYKAREKDDCVRQVKLLLERSALYVLSQVALVPDS